MVLSPVAHALLTIAALALGAAAPPEPQAADAASPLLPLPAISSEYRPAENLPAASAPVDVKALEQRLAELEQRESKRAAAEQKKKTADAAKPTVKWTAELQADSYAFNQDAANRAQFGDIQNGSAFRRARIAMHGDYGPTNYRLEMDYAQSGRPSFLAVYGGLHDLPLIGHLRVGHFFEPFGLDRLTSNRYATFMERSAIDQAFFPARNTGVLAMNNWAGDNGVWGLGYFRADSDNFGDDVGDNFENAVTGRITALPYYSADGSHLLHIGADYSFRGTNDNAAQFRAQPEARVGATSPNVPFFVDTGPIPANYFQQADFEVAWVNGPLSIQSEYVFALINADDGTSPLMRGWYAQASYFLTGEHRVYSKKTGAFTRVHPNADFVRHTGDPEKHYVCFASGAWQVATRLSKLDFNDANVHGGQQTDLTVGLNWYLTPYLRYTANYIHAFVTDPAAVKSNADIFGMRVGYEF